MVMGENRRSVLCLNEASAQPNDRSKAGDGSPSSGGQEEKKVHIES